jgi:ubiquinone/menaquinone biosynthesis C-methylase UbiE
MSDELLFTRLAAAYVRGSAPRPAGEGDPALFDAPLDQLDADQQLALIALGRAAGLRLHRFKRTMGLPRVAKVLGLLRGLAPAELLDIGSGRGAFLWPLLDAMPGLPVAALDTLDYRVADIQAVAAGGVAGLRAFHGSATGMPFDDRSFDVLTMLEVLEHIPDTAAALHEALRVARRFVVLSVPSKADDNPEHIHLFDAAALDRLLRAAGAARVTFEYVPGHIVAVARRATYSEEQGS